jgi:hypothetical protein
LTWINCCKAENWLFVSHQYRKLAMTASSDPVKDATEIEWYASALYLLRSRAIAMGCAPARLLVYGGMIFDLTRGRVHVRRSKAGETAVHPIGGKEIRALRRLQRESGIRSPYVFISERVRP